MKPHTFIKDYKENEIYRRSFNSLANQTFQIDFEPWYHQGFWNDRYICYSYLEGNTVIANVSISKMQLIVNGDLKQAVQIGTVMTHPNYRKQGLASSLITTVLNEYEQADIYFLFAGEHVTNFYKKFGFTHLQESRFRMPIEPTKPYRNPQKLEFDNEKQFIIDYYTKKRSSTLFDIEHAEHVLGFYAHHGFGNDFYFVAELDAVVVYKIAKDQLHLYGYFSQQEFPFEKIVTYIVDETVKEVVFHFTPQWSDIKPTIEPIYTSDDIFHIRSKIELPRSFKFPLLAHA